MFAWYIYVLRIVGSRYFCVFYSLVYNVMISCFVQNGINKVNKRFAVRIFGAM